MRAAPLLVSLFVVVTTLLVGCPDVAGEGGGDATGEGEGEGGGGGTDVELGCDGDDACDDGLVCDLDSGDCVAGFDCSVNPGICDFCGDADVDCGPGFGSADAFCDVDGGNVCRRTKGPCAVCSVDSECAEGPTGLASVCSDGFCAPGCGPCGTGFACVDGGCAPLPDTTTTGTCEGAALCSDDDDCADGLRCSSGVCLKLCEADVDCPIGRVCQEDGPTASTCVQGCPYESTVLQDGVQLICHRDGRYGTPCTTPGSTDGCPPSMECTASGACDLAGCQDDSECPLARTYCDVATAACLDGCNDDSDCGAFELCDVAAHVCEPQGCRSKNTSCNTGEVCCGKELYEDDSTCPARAADGDCFFAQDPFWRTGDDDDDCADI
ncbi:MAG TPA: hypothetical protein VGF99_06615, partial [Myxococcota bacterium]